MNCIFCNIEVSTVEMLDSELIPEICAACTYAIEIEREDEQSEHEWNLLPFDEQEDYKDEQQD